MSSSTLPALVLLGLVTLLPSPVRALSGLVMNQTAIIVDNYGAVNLDDVADRDKLRDEVAKRQVLMANNFVAALKSGSWRRELERLVDPAAVASIPPSVVTALEGLQPIDYDGTWDAQDQERLDKIRVALALKGLLDFGVPGKVELDEEPGGAAGEALATYLAEAADADPAFLRRVREYEDAYQRLCVIRVEGSSGERSTTPFDVEGAILGMMNDATAGVANPPPDSLVYGFVDHVASLFVDPSASGWRINPSWWNVTLASGALAAAGDTYSLVSGAQLLGVKMNEIDPATATAEEIVEALSTARKYSLAYRGRVYTFADAVPGTWSGGAELAYHAGSVASSTESTHQVRILEWVGVKDEPLTIMAADMSEQVSGLGAALPEFPVSEELLLILKLIEAFQEPATNVPASEPDTEVEGGGGPTPGVFTGGGGIGSSF